MTNPTRLSPDQPSQSPSQPDFRLCWLEACELLERVTTALADEYARDARKVVVYPVRGKRYGAAGAGRRYLDEHIPALLAIVREVRS